MDRTTRGFLAGIIAAIVQNAWNLFDYYFLHITKIRFLDWSAVLATLAKPTSSLQAVIDLMVQIVIWDGFLGIIFSHLLDRITSKWIIYKSTFYGLLLWFCFRAIVNLYRVPFLSGMQPLSGRLSNALSVILWGITLGVVLKKFEGQAKYG